MLQMYNRVALLYINKLNEATQLSDGEKMNEYLEKIKDSSLEIVKIKYAIDEFLNRIKNRFNENDMINFKKLLSDIGYDNDNEIKL
jgi:uncharacterized protein YpiB (UPF0302 family)